jgi:hypothetical protein
MLTSSIRTKYAARVCIGIILASASLAAVEPPPNLGKRVAERATAARLARDHYTYRQSVDIEELTSTGTRNGQYREVREVIFSPEQARAERVIGRPSDTLKRLKLTEEDFRDVREVQPFLFDSEQLFAYETRYKGEESMDGEDCWILQVRPRQILAGQRLFDGLLWVSQKDLAIVRTEGKAVPEIRGMQSENLFPHFTTLWQRVEGGYSFPIHTFADDTLDFRVGPQRIRLNIRYLDYKRFGAESTVKFGEETK